MEVKGVLYPQLSSLLGRWQLREGDEVGHLAELVNNGKYDSFPWNRTVQ